MTAVELIISAYLEMRERGVRVTWEIGNRETPQVAPSFWRPEGGGRGLHRPSIAAKARSQQPRFELRLRPYVTAFSASHWVIPPNHVTPACHINRGKEKAEVRHFVDAGSVRVSAGAGRRGAEDPFDGVWI